jgi:hypothetical protein
MTKEEIGQKESDATAHHLRHPNCNAHFTITATAFNVNYIFMILQMKQ